MAITQFTDPTPVLQRLSASLGGGQAGVSSSPFGQAGQSMQQLLSSSSEAPAEDPAASLPAPPAFTPPAPPPQIDFGPLQGIINRPATPAPPPPPPPPSPGGGRPLYTDPQGRPMHPGSPGWVPGMNGFGNGNPVGRGW